MKNNGIYAGILAVLLIFGANFATNADDFGDVMKFIEAGDKHFNNKQYDKAITSYTTAISKLPTNAGGKIDKVLSLIYAQRGTCYNIKEDYVKALTDYNNAIKLDSTNVDGYQGRYKIIVRMVIATAETAPNDAKEYVNLALSDIEMVLKLNPKDADAKKFKEILSPYK